MISLIGGAENLAQGYFILIRRGQKPLK
jgi:hypothetical protein